MADPQQTAAGDGAVEHPGALKKAATMGIAKMAAFQNLIAQFTRRWRGQRPAPAGRLGVELPNRPRSKSPRPRDQQVHNVTYNEFLKLLKDGKEVLIAFYDNENVIPYFEEFV
jgi:hypothetical protein